MHKVSKASKAYFNYFVYGYVCMHGMKVYVRTLYALCVCVCIPFFLDEGEFI